MKKLLFGAVLLMSATVVPLPTMAEVNINIGFTLPPPIVFQEPPAVIVLPDTNYVYVVPDISVDIFFWDGWWWRPWEGRWYRSRYYDRGWAYYDRVPRFYYDVDPGWRGYYRHHDWHGHRWNHEWIPNRQLQQHWKSWNNNRYWERHGTWGVQNYQPRPQQQRQDLRRQRQIEYQQRPEVQRHQQQRQEQQQKRQIQNPGRPQPPRDQRYEPQGNPHREESQRHGPHGNPHGENPERGR